VLDYLKAWSPIRLIVTGCLGVMFLAGINFKGWDFNAGRDFLGFYVGASLVGSPTLYNPEANLAVQRKLGAREIDSIIFVRLPYFAAILRPLTWIQYRAAILAWGFLSVASLIGFALVFPYEESRITLFMLCWFIPAAFAIRVGQDPPFVILWIAIALRLRMHKRLFLAGLVFSLCLEKWHLLIFIPILFLLRREWRVFAGFVTGSAVLIAFSFALQGPDFAREYWAAMHLPNMNALPLLMPNLLGSLAFFEFFGLSHSIAVALYWGLAIVITLLVLFACVRQQFEIALPVALIAGLLLSPHDYLHDWTIAFPALLMLWRVMPAIVSILLLPAAALPLGLNIGIVLPITVAAFQILIELTIPGEQGTPVEGVRSAISRPRGPGDSGSPQSVGA